MPGDYTQATASLGFWQSTKYTVRQFRLLDMPQQLMEEWYQMAQDVCRSRVELKPGAKEYLSCLRGQGVSLSAATSSRRGLFLPTLERHGVLDWSDAIVTVSEMSRGRGFPDIYEGAARRIWRPSQECVISEDLPNVLRDARSGGFYAVGVLDSYSKDEEMCLRQVSGRFIYDFRELL